jgi:2-amino-4-hydroxy-6-hydroxymethyldihydropteridine diphosphokinase
MLFDNQLCARVGSLTSPGYTVLALGSNLPSWAGDSTTTLRCGLQALNSRGLHPVLLSPFYVSAAMGATRQPPYVNAVVAVRTAAAIGDILRIVKDLERIFGRRSGRRWGARPLDIDIISHRGQSAAGALGWVDRAGRATALSRGKVVLPHPELHRRNFVLKPLCDILPHWWHPVFNKTAKQLLHALPPQRRGSLLRLSIDPVRALCQTRA